jgi:hypothetical protein
MFPLILVRFIFVKPLDLGLLFLVSTFFASCSDCDRQILSEDTSPSGDMVAMVTVTNCGAWTDFSTAVNLRSVGAPSSVMDGLVFGADGKHSVITAWKDGQTLVVYLPTSTAGDSVVCPKIAHQNSEVKGIHIEYRQLR